MWFNSLDFLCFILVVVPVFYALGAVRSGVGMPRIVFLLVASYFFYMYWNPAYIVLILATTTIDYTCGRLFLRWPRDRRKWIVAISVVCDLGILAVFKYSKFVYSTAAALLGPVGLDLPPWPYAWGEIPPVGISFFTFQSMSYTIDVYRGKTQAERNFLRFALFVAFFPQLVAGPIEKARDLLVQFRDVRRSRPTDVRGGLEQAAYGLFKKVAVADTLGIFVRPIFESPGSYSGAMVLVACVFFSFQIYCDFSGYTDIAIGVAKLFGVRLSDNFLFPYFSTSVREFWRRWHISLSSWLREYLYFSLGGNRKGRVRTYANVMITMLLGGLWHGNTWNFALWGFLHGVYLCVHRLWLAVWPGAKQVEAALAAGPAVAGAALADPPRRPWLRAATAGAAGLVTFALVTLAWMPFRCKTFGDTLICARQIFTWASAPFDSMGIEVGALAVSSALVGVLLVFDVFYRLESRFAARWTWASWVRCAFPAVFVLLTIVFGAEEAQQFIYFQF